MKFAIKTVAAGAIGTTSLLCATMAMSQEKLGEIVPELSLSYYAADMGPVYEQSARVLSQEWAKLGLKFQMRPIQFSTFVSDIIVGGKLEDMAVFSVGADPDRIDPTFYLNNISACGQRANGSSWCDDEYTKMAEKQLTLVDSDERLKTVHAMQERFQSQIPWWPVTNTVYGILYNSDKWENVTNPSPVAAHENLVDPWLAARPLTVFWTGPIWRMSAPITRCPKRVRQAGCGLSMTLSPKSVPTVNPVLGLLSRGNLLMTPRSGSNCAKI